MSRGAKRAALAFVAVLAVAQFLQPNRANPSTDATRTFAHADSARALTGILDRSCGDCHSNQSTWPWYARVAPLSWVWATGIKEGRKSVNFSEWLAYPVERRRELLEQSCRTATQGTMPGGVYTFLRPAARLSRQDIDAICSAAHQS